MIQFDTRDKKPKVWNIAVLSAAALAAVLIMINIGTIPPAAIGGTVAVYLAMVIIFLLSAFYKQLQYNPYSYNTIYYVGFSIFFLFVLITHIGLTIKMALEPAAYDTEMILYTMLGSAKNYMIFTSPFIFFFAALLCISNVSLIKHEGRRRVNIFGIILSLILVGGEVFLFFFDRHVSGSQTYVMLHDLFGNLFAAVYLYFECMVIGTIIANVIAVRYEPEKDKDFIIILGCGLLRDGTPTPLLKGRIDRALNFYRQQKEETGKEAYFVTSGGQGPREVTSECASMKRYLIGQGIPEERIIEEDKSVNTFENMKFSKEKILAVNPEGKVAFSTTNYHVFRSGIYARRNKMRAVGMGAKTKWYFWPNAAVREFFGILQWHRLKQGLIFGSIILVYVLLTFYVYR